MVLERFDTHPAWKRAGCFFCLKLKQEHEEEEDGQDQGNPFQTEVALVREFVAADGAFAHTCIDLHRARRAFFLFHGVNFKFRFPNSKFNVPLV